LGQNLNSLFPIYPKDYSVFIYGKQEVAHPSARVHVFKLKRTLWTRTESVVSFIKCFWRTLHSEPQSGKGGGFTRSISFQISWSFNEVFEYMFVINFNGLKVSLDTVHSKLLEQITWWWYRINGTTALS